MFKLLLRGNKNEAFSECVSFVSGGKSFEKKKNCVFIRSQKRKNVIYYEKHVHKVTIFCLTLRSPASSTEQSFSIKRVMFSLKSSIWSWESQFSVFSSSANDRQSKQRYSEIYKTHTRNVCYFWKRSREVVVSWTSSMLHAYLRDFWLGLHVWFWRRFKNIYRRKRINILVKVNLPEMMMRDEHEQFKMKRQRISRSQLSAVLDDY